MQIGEFLAAMWILSNPVECDMSKTRTYAEWSTLTPGPNVYGMACAVR